MEGPTEDQAINAVRAKQKRNFLTTLFISQGVPMLKAGNREKESGLKDVEWFFPNGAEVKEEEHSRRPFCYCVALCS